jgi:hypothetical protein
MREQAAQPVQRLQHRHRVSAAPDNHGFGRQRERQIGDLVLDHVHPIHPGRRRGELLSSHGDQLGETLLERMLRDDLTETDRGPAAQRPVDVRPQRPRVDVDLFEQGRRVGLRHGVLDCSAVQARFAHPRVERAFHRQADPGPRRVQFRRDREVPVTAQPRRP